MGGIWRMLEQLVGQANAQISNGAGQSRATPQLAPPANDPFGLGNMPPMTDLPIDQATPRHSTRVPGGRRFFSSSPCK